MIVGLASYTLKRNSGGAVDANGEWAGATEATSTVYLSVQPMPGEEAELLPEGFRQRRALKAYGDRSTVYRTWDQYGDTEADRIEVGGVDFYILSRADYGAVIPHQRLVLVAAVET